MTALLGLVSAGCQADVVTSVDAHEDGTATVSVHVHLDSDASSATREHITDAVSAMAVHAGVETGAVQVHDNGDVIDLDVVTDGRATGTVSGVGKTNVTMTGGVCQVDVPLEHPVELAAALDAAAAKDVDPAGARAVMGASVLLSVQVSCPGGVSEVTGVEGAAIFDGKATLTASMDNWPVGTVTVTGSAHRGAVWWQRPIFFVPAMFLGAVWLLSVRRHRRNLRAIGYR